jgi:hypothetical protein
LLTKLAVELRTKASLSGKSGLQLLQLLPEIHDFQVDQTWKRIVKKVSPPQDKTTFDPLALSSFPTAPAKQDPQWDHPRWRKPTSAPALSGLESLPPEIGNEVWGKCLNL